MAASVIWVTGAGGLIGNYLVQSARTMLAEQIVIPLTRARLDLIDLPSVRQAFREQKPWLIVHCAALSRSPECQANPGLAHTVNVESTSLLAELADRLVFFSTDLVFDGKLGNYGETADVNPLSVYAETKVAAERIVLHNPNHLVVRTSLNSGTSPTRDRGFDEQLVKAWQSRQTLRLFTDEFRSPISAEITARAVWELVLQKRTGLYHIAGAERLSRWQIGQLIAARRSDLNPQIQPASLKQYQGAPRAPDTSLNCAKAQAVLSFPLPRFGEWIKAQG
jgi:dTDP-4-dehydrorhamnose reductase